MEPRLRTVAEAYGGVFSTADARSVDVDDPTLRALVRAGEVVRVRRGAYVLGQAWAAAEHEAALRLRTMSVLRTRDEDVATHQAALSLHRLPLHGVRLDVVDVQSPVSRVRLAAGLRTQPGRLAHLTVDGARCVAVEHAIVQVLRRSGLESALVPLDHALRTKMCTLPRIEAALETPAPAGAAALGKRLVELADPRCDSPGETRTRLLLRDLGFAPRSQVTICDESDAFVARVDFLVEGRVVVEFDGLQKYAGADGRAALAAEKRREDRLRSLGYVVVRLVWADLARPAHVADLLRRALAQARSTSA
jgi:very-short-patch-repair endonuclease